MISKDKELIHMQLRLFRMACREWNMSITECADVFDQYRIDKYIDDAYEIFHVQGDEANFAEIDRYARSKGAIK